MILRNTGIYLQVHNPEDQHHHLIQVFVFTGSFSEANAFVLAVEMFMLYSSEFTVR
jgi:hypothetical protein